MFLKIEKIQKSFEEKHVLKGTSFTFEQGKIYGLLGRNGAGKTTLFNCISDEVNMDGGSKVLRDRAYSPMEWREVGYVYAEPILPEFLTGYEFIRFFIDVNKERIEDLRTIEEYLALVDLNREDWFCLIQEYSQGMKSKLQLLCLFILKPSVILLDEPLTSLDIVVQRQMKEMLRSIKKDHIIIFSTHILELAMDLCDEIVVLNNGILEWINSEEIHGPEFQSKVFAMLTNQGDE